MENLILFYLIIILMLIFGMMALLFWFQEDTTASDKLSFKVKLLCVGSVFIGIMVLHMCWMLLPYYIEQHGDLKGYLIVLFIAAIHILPVTYWIFKNTFVVDSLPEELKTDPSTI
ncbi:hypothetical protein BH23BAC1_BH23BAC1_43050 [soil metagenome]